MMIDATYRILLRKPRNVSLNDILVESGLSTRAFYRHFRSKDDLLIAMFDAESERMVAEVEDQVRGAGSPQEQLKTWIRQFLAVSFEPRRFRRAQVMLSPGVSRAEGYAAAQTRSHMRHRELVSGILEAGVRDGSFRHSDPVADAATIHDIVLRIVARRHEGIEEMDHAATLAHILSFVGRAIGLER
jgi:AcrR family transcriptional regulator